MRRAATAVVEAPTEAKAAPPPPPPFDPAKQLGVTQPLGYFDPLGFCKVGDEAAFRNLRSAEMKHGRVAMMAAVGAVAQAAFQFPGFESVPKGLGAVLSAPGTYGFAALFLLSGALELTVWKDDPWPSSFLEALSDPRPLAAQPRPLSKHPPRRRHRHHHRRLSIQPSSWESPSPSDTSTRWDSARSATRPPSATCVRRR